MTPELAEHISLLAAPIYAALLTPWVTRGELVPAATLDTFRRLAIQQAQALWLETLDTPDAADTIERLRDALDEIRRHCGENGETGADRGGRWAAEVASNALEHSRR